MAPAPKTSKAPQPAAPRKSGCLKGAQTHGPLLVVLLGLCWSLFVSRTYWEFPQLDEDPADVARFKEVLAEYMKNKPVLTEEQMQAYWRDGWLVMDEFAPKELMSLLDKSNKQFKPYTWHLNTFEDYTTKSYMGWLESQMFAEWDLNGPLKHVTKQLLDWKFNRTLSGVRLWNELILATTGDADGIELHYDRGSYSHLEDDEPGVSTWMLLADMTSSEFGGALSVLNMSHVPEHCLLQQEGQNFRPFTPECVNATEAAVYTPDVRQGALIFFSRWCYHRTGRRLQPWPAGFERTLQVARWVRPEAKIVMYEQPNDKTGGGRSGNKFAGLALGARNYFCRARIKPGVTGLPQWANDILSGSTELTAADAPNFDPCAPELHHREKLPTYDDLQFSYTPFEVLKDWPAYFIGEHYKMYRNGKMTATEAITTMARKFPIT